MRARIRKLEELAASAGAPDPGGARVQSGGSSDRVGELAIALAEAADEYRGRLLRALREMRRVERCISGVRDAQDRRMLELRYIDGLSYAELAAEMSYYDAANARRRLWAILARVGGKD